MPITLVPTARCVVLRTRSSCYAFCWGDADVPLRHLHWGGPLTDEDALTLAAAPSSPSRQQTNTTSWPRGADEEYPFRGGLRRDPVACAVTMPDGVRDLDLQCTAAPVAEDADTLVVTLSDRHYPLRIELRYRLDEQADAITRSATIINDGTSAVRITEAASASWPVSIPAGAQLVTCSGGYGAESRITRGDCPVGSFAIESRSGIPGHHALPFVALHRSATEGAGEVWSTALSWSGNYRIGVEHADDGRLYVVGGVNPFDLAHELPGGEALKLPSMTGVYAPDGLTGTSHRWHRHLRERVLPLPDRPRPVIANSWEAFYYDVRADQQLELARSAADLGVELLAVDDGWFGRRTDNDGGLGDWFADRSKFPDGVRALSDAVHELGMGFGLWVEPESIQQDSRAYAEHPDWVYSWPTRDSPMAGNRLMLDFGRPEVVESVTDVLSRLVTDARLDYLKWDLNQPMSVPNSPASDAGAAWLAHVRGVYAVWDELRRRHPDLWLETCSSGGGRADIGALAHSHWAWPSDNTDPVDRLDIQEGFSLVNPALTMGAWVTDSPALAHRPTPLQFRFHVAMCGALVIGGDVRAWTAEQRELGRRMIGLYRRLRPVIQFGELYRLSTSTPDQSRALMYNTQQRSAVFVFAPQVLRTTRRHTVRLRGLDPAARYRVIDTGDVGDVEAAGADQELVRGSGALLMHHGIEVDLRGSYASRLLVVDRV